MQAHRLSGEEAMRFHGSLAAPRVSAARAVTSPLNHCPLALCTLLESQTPGRKSLAELLLSSPSGARVNSLVSSSEKRTHYWTLITIYVGDYCTDDRTASLGKVTLLLILLPSGTRWVVTGEKGYPGDFVQNVLEQGQLARN